jgi:TolB-like protein
MRAAPLPAAPAWLNGQHIAVEGPLKVGVGGPELAAAGLHGSVQTDLRSAGFEVVQDASADELRLSLDSFERTSGAETGGTIVKASLWRADREVDRFEITAEKLGCVSPLWGVSAQQNAECFSRGVVSALLRSEKVALAAANAPGTPYAQRAPPVQTLAAQPSPPRGDSTAMAAPVQARALPLRGKLAVLDLKNFTRDLSKENAQYFSDVIRQASLRMEPGLDIMTRENLVVLLQATGKKLEECEGECEVDTGRRIGADHIVSGEIQKVGSRYKLTLRLHDTKEGRLLASSIGSGKSIDELDESAQKAAEELFTAR